MRSHVRKEVRHGKEKMAIVVKKNWIRAQNRWKSFKNCVWGYFSGTWWQYGELLPSYWWKSSTKKWNSFVVFAFVFMGGTRCILAKIREKLGVTVYVFLSYEATLENRYCFEITVLPLVEKYVKEWRLDEGTCDEKGWFSKARTVSIMMRLVSPSELLRWFSWMVEGLDWGWNYCLQFWSKTNEGTPMCKFGQKWTEESRWYVNDFLYWICGIMKYVWCYAKNERLAECLVGDQARKEKKKKNVNWFLVPPFGCPCGWRCCMKNCHLVLVWVEMCLGIPGCPVPWGA